MKLNSIYNFIENKSNKTLEIIVFILYVVGISALAFWHEPWFDEFQALQISKESVHDILFFIPHMEGHPPLWHLIIKFTSIFTNNPELCIKIPNIIFATGAIWLLIFKSPFNKIIKVSLPFTYFIFYQYGVVCRPYAILMFALFLAASFYPKRNENPFRFVVSLGLLCLSSCYGILIAFAITLAWLIETYGKQQFLPFVKSFVKDKRFYAMLALLLLCLFIFFEIYPVENEIAMLFITECSIYHKIFYSLFGSIADVTFFNVCNYGGTFGQNLIDIYNITVVIFGIYITYLLVKYFLKNNILLFIMTYSIWLLFICFGYFYPHHTGLLILILIFNFWCSDFKKVQNEKFLKQLVVIIGITLLVQIYWSISSVFLEIKHDYSYGRSVATYIKNNAIADKKYKIFCPWYVRHTFTDENGKISHTLFQVDKNAKIVKATRKNIYSNQPFAVEINSYFDKNIFYNFNTLYPKRQYVMHSDPDGISEKTIFDVLKSNGTPDIMLFYSSSIVAYSFKSAFPDLKKSKISWDLAFDGVDFMHEYLPVKEFPNGFIWKGNYYDNTLYMYVKKSLYENAKNWK